MSGGEFAEIEARANAATEGPWVHPYPECRDIRNYDHEIVVDSFSDGIGAGVLEQADAEFIANAREDIPRLLAAVRERDNTIARVRAAMYEHEKYLPTDLHPACCALCSALTGRDIRWPCVPYARLRAALDPQETE